MNVTIKDLVIIEHALQELLTNSTDKDSCMKYQQVLDNLRSQRMSMSEEKAIPSDLLDGYRFDYDDVSNLTEPRH